MQGRYGFDQLNMALVIVAFILSIVQMYVPAGVGMAFTIVSLILLGYALFRSFSKNIYGRNKENRGFMKIWNPIKNIFKPRPDAKTHKHYSCPKCGQKMRVPKGKGKIMITCSNCGHKFAKKT